ncbi:hypothetical protein FACS1894102_2190 [Spirochaetia bacterium]|nr:hypothetical protein FACS1894102_2190 [Spirochaetia bacterium]
MKKISLASFIMLCAFAVQVSALGSGSKNDAIPSGLDSDVVMISGVVRLVGNDPNVETIIRDSEKNDWYVPGDEGVRLREYNRQQITISGNASGSGLTLGDGKKMGMRRSISNITIIKIETKDYKKRN